MRATLVAIAALNSFSDFAVYLYPAKPLWSLHLPVKQRLGLIFLFSVGLLVCVAGVLRMYYLEVFFDSYDTHCMSSLNTLLNFADCFQGLASQSGSPWFSK